MKIITACLAFFIAFSLTAQDTSESEKPPKISGDRPGFGVSTMNMPSGLFQMEAGYQGDIFSYQNGGFMNWINLVPATLRYGLTDWLELKTDLTYRADAFEYFPNNTREFKGLLPVAVGARLGVLQDQELLPNVMLYGTVGIPLKPNQTSNADLRLLVTKQITPTVSVDGNAGLLLRQGTNVFQYAISGTAAVSDKVSFFAEYYGQVESQINQGFIDGGLVFYPTNNFQVDVSAGRRVLISANNLVLRSGENYTFFSVGAAMRIPR